MMIIFNTPVIIPDTYKRCHPERRREASQSKDPLFAHAIMNRLTRNRLRLNARKRKEAP
jgi:hypothetical protein